METIRLAVDVQSGDYGYGVLLDGVLEARKKSNIPLVVHLCGNEREIAATLDSLGGTKYLNKHKLVIEHCYQTINSDEIPSRVWKNKKESSIIKCITLQKEGVVSASLSAGDTRILTGASLFLLGRFKEVARPALAAFLPTTKSHPSLLIDVGANLNCRVEHLVAFGLMGYNYISQFFSIDNPSVALLNIGKESFKGTKTIIEAGKILSKRCSGYIGFIEGSRVLAGDADVVVCDGFSGNILLKACESFHVLTESVLKGNRRLVNKLKKNMAILNAENYGAVPLLGIRGIVLKAHGASSSKAITHALLTAIKAVQQKMFTVRISD